MGQRVVGDGAEGGGWWQMEVGDGAECGG